MTINCLNCGIEFKDRPNRILSGRTKYCSKKCMDIIQKGNPKTSGENSNHWKGDNVTYQAKHMRVRKYRGYPTKCEQCGKESSNNRIIHWANKSHEYRRDLSDWIRLCIKCHKKYDDLSGKLKQAWANGSYANRRVGI